MNGDENEQSKITVIEPGDVLLAVGLVFLVAFCLVVWWPAALLAGAAIALLGAAWLTRSP